MATPAPTHSIGDVVYLNASARIGFLEAYTVTNIIRIRRTWAYTLSVGVKPPSEPTMGDAINLKQNVQMYFQESEIVGYHEALLLAKNALTLKLQRINQLLEKHFPDSSS